MQMSFPVKKTILGVLLCGAMSFHVVAKAQEPAAPVVPADRAPVDAEKAAKGKKIFTANCSFCHGADARGGEVGPNLVRSKIVSDDKNGELISQVVKKGVPSRGMPPISIDDESIADVVQFLHSLQVPPKAASVRGSQDVGRYLAMLK